MVWAFNYGLRGGSYSQNIRDGVKKMKNKELKNHIIREYLKLIKDTKPLEYDLICDKLNIPQYTIRTSVPDAQWLKLWQQPLDEVLKDSEEDLS